MYNCPHLEKVGQRKKGFEEIIRHLSAIKDTPGFLIETGTARIAGNWLGDGQSTLLWNWWMDQSDDVAISIDLNPEYIHIAKSQAQDIWYMEGDSVQTLATMDDKILSKTKLLYLDSYDWSVETHLESAFHHMAELAAVYSKLPQNCLIVVDDCHTKDLGKHVLVQYFFQKLNKKPVFTGYQTGWIKGE